GSNPEALAMLIKQARDYSNRYRQNVFKQLAKRTTIQGLVVLREVALDTTDPCQVYAIQALLDFGGKDSLPILEKILADPKVSIGTRQAAKEAFEKLTK
ncbi:hypothetical protein ACFL54_08915, partial [Planctomycetota bacterium]